MRTPATECAAAGIEKAKEALRKLRFLVKIISMEKREVDSALNSSFSDFEDALQYYTAMRHRMDVLLTRNIKDYKEKELIIQTPEQFIKTI
ncbi:PIN domain-containing protein [Treponema parvum]|uniref:PIN domain-containing protein n=1 Tax=Treponema parvum TaxID=138851 RepID=UPI0021168B74|nr:PIN domain-containing protein [Treponema parvum]